MNLDVKADKEYIAQSRETLRSGVIKKKQYRVKKYSSKSGDFAQRVRAIHKLIQYGRFKK